MKIFTSDDFFYNEFERHAAKTLEGCKALAELVSSNSDRLVGAKQIADLEHECDSITHAVVAKLHTSFITPLDRNEIYRLITKMDDVIDLVEATAERLALYELHEQQAEMAALAGVLLESATRVCEAVSGFRDMKHPQLILDKCVEINRLEGTADALLRAGLARLFREERDPIAIMKWKELYELIETATDRCEDVANTIEGVVLENS